MVMVVHKTIAMYDGIVSFNGRFKIFQKLLSVSVALEYTLLFIASGSYVIKGARKGYP
jgi:hypothetical protein